MKDTDNKDIAKYLFENTDLLDDFYISKHIVSSLKDKGLHEKIVKDKLKVLMMDLNKEGIKYSFEPGSYFDKAHAFILKVDIESLEPLDLDSYKHLTPLNKINRLKSCLNQLVSLCAVFDEKLFLVDELSNQSKSTTSDEADNCVRSNKAGGLLPGCGCKTQY